VLPRFDRWYSRCSSSGPWAPNGNTNRQAFPETAPPCQRATGRLKSDSIDFLGLLEAYKLSIPQRLILCSSTPQPNAPVGLDGNIPPTHSSPSLSLLAPISS
jgi:hypothetical protein